MATSELPPETAAAPASAAAPSSTGSKVTASGAAPEAPLLLSPGREVGNYIIESLIGSGGMAQVYRVRHAVLGTSHALKVLDARFRGLLEVRQRFLSEGLIAAKLAHRHVVKVTDAIATPEVAGLVMELVEGPTLERYVGERPAPLSLSEVRELFVPVLDAMAEAHRRGIIHRDIKPANILLDLSAGRPVPKVTDFGIAKVLSPERSGLGGLAELTARGLTRTESRMGTLAYMSPEQIRGAKEVTLQSDIFSLGATLYEACTKELAFDGDSEYEIMRNIVEGRLHRPERLDGLDPVIGGILQRALAPKPEARFASCEEFALALLAKSAPKAQRRETSGRVATGRPAAAATPASQWTPGREAPPPMPIEGIPESQWTPGRVAPATPVAAAPSGSPTPPAVAAPPLTGTRRCPYCNEVIQASARKCKHCQEYLDPELRKEMALRRPSTDAIAEVPDVRQGGLAYLDWPRLKPSLQSFFIPGLGQILHGKRNFGLALLGIGLGLHAAGTESVLLFLYHSAAALVAYWMAAPQQPTTGPDGPDASLDV